MTRVSAGERERAKRDAAAEARVRMVPIEITLPTGRPATVLVPGDITDSEWLALVGMVPKIRDKMRAELDPKKPQLELPPTSEAPRKLRPV